MQGNDNNEPVQVNMHQMWREHEERLRREQRERDGDDMVDYDGDRVVSRPVRLQMLRQFFMRGAQNRVQRQTTLDAEQVEKFINEKVKSIKYEVPQDQNKNNTVADEGLTDKVDDEDIEAAY